jgi:probable F420-dependent oxidoreductase
MRPFRFGLVLERFSDPTYVLETARRAEGEGFSTFLIRDHLIDEPFGPQYAPWTTLATVAQVTRTLRVGSLVIANDFRHPAVLAKEVTTLDQLSAGRVELGLGAGFLREEFERTGMTFYSNKVRVDRLAESLQVLDPLLRGCPVSHAGEHYTFDGFVNFPPPVQQPRPPILVAGAGRRVLSIAAQHADTVALLSAPLSGGVLVDSAESRSARNVAAQVEVVRNAAGPRFADLELSVFATLIVAEDRHDAADMLARQRGWAVPPQEVLEMPTVLVGDTELIVADLVQRRAEHGISYIVVKDSQFADAIPLVQRLAGTH